MEASISLTRLGIQYLSEVPLCGSESSGEIQIIGHLPRPSEFLEIWERNMNFLQGPR